VFFRFAGARPLLGGRRADRGQPAWFALGVTARFGAAPQAG